MYDALLVIHILAGMAWLGGGLMITVTLAHARRAHGHEAVEVARARFAWADTWLAIGGPLLVIGTGVAMVLMREFWKFSQSWIYGALGIIVLYQVLAGTIGGRAYRMMRDAAKEDRVGGEEYERALATNERLGAALLLLLAVIVVLMVAKPGV